MKEYKGYYIEPFIEGGYTVFYCGDEFYFDTTKEAKEFIDTIAEDFGNDN